MGQQLDLEQHLHGSAYGSPIGYGTITGTNAGKYPAPNSYSKCLVPQLMDMDNAVLLLHWFVLQMLSMWYLLIHPIFNNKLLLFLVKKN